MQQLVPQISKSLDIHDMESIENLFDDYHTNHSNDKYINEYTLLTSPKEIVENANGIPGLYYVKNFLNKDELEKIKTMIGNDVIFSPITSSANSRRVAHFGYNYSYDRSGLTEAPCIPDEFAKIVSPKRINKILGKKLIDSNFNQLIINEYKPGQQISYHTDHTSQFGPIIACLTIGQSAQINFKNENQTKKITPVDGSLYIMTAESRYNWKHSLCNHGNTNRYSLTYRHVI